eukprot:TRINITY_DN2696_c0_g1_i4.p1 TRINITY_DN2696_c0_g1~~TRINITY_DN2696_c0_g1_i4.p1  ORF type:complete len:277 (-),score=13.60 TRINITY_DN2696_c0_g1_i4:13-843(-)
MLQCFLLGSILSRLVLTLGLCIFIGGIKHKVLKINSRNLRKNTLILNLSLASLLIPYILWLGTILYSQSSLESQLRISRYTALFLLINFPLLLIHHSTHKKYYKQKLEPIPYVLNRVGCIIFFMVVLALILGESILMVDAVSDLTNPSEILSHGWGEKYIFIGVVLLPLVNCGGDIISYAKLSMMNDLGTVLYSQISACIGWTMFVFPVMVLFGWLLDVNLTSVFLTMPLVSTLVCVVFLNLFLGVGEVTWFEGYLLVMGYVVLVVAFFFHPVIRT